MMSGTPSLFRSPVATRTPPLNVVPKAKKPNRNVPSPSYTRTCGPPPASAPTTTTDLGVSSGGAAMFGGTGGGVIGGTFGGPFVASTAYENSDVSPVDWFVAVAVTNRPAVSGVA